MKSFWIVLVLLVTLAACGPVSLPGSNDDAVLTGTQEVVNELKALCCEDGWWGRLPEAEYTAREGGSSGEELDAGAVFLESLEADGEKFEVNDYFKVLTHLSPEDGYVLDYVYFAPGGGDGAPYLYARPASDPAFLDHAAYKMAGSQDYLNHIQVDGTAQGYYELAVLSVMGGQFYLGWHFGYNDWEVVGSRERVEEIIALMNEEYQPFTGEEENAALQLETPPSVKIGVKKVRVSLLLFTKWGGFYEGMYTIDRDFPHQIREDKKQVIPYECGVTY